MERLRREIDSKVAAGFSIEGGYDARRPWDAVFLAASLDRDFWNAEVTEAALLFVADARMKGELLDPGHHAVEQVENKESIGGGRAEAGTTEGPPSRAKARREAAKRRRLADGQGELQRDAHPKGSKGEGRGKGRGKGSKGKKQVRYAWNRDEGGCPSPCPNYRVHECEVCGSTQHNGKGCPNVK